MALVVALVYRSVMVYNEHINKLAQVKGVRVNEQTEQM